MAVEVPKWVSSSVFEIFYDFLNFKNLVYWSDKTKPISDNSLQRLLWIADYFQMESFQERCIQDLIIPRLQLKNCLLFLNEAFKKLRACEDSKDVWYTLLNVSINFTSKNIVQIFEERREEVVKINGKILEEIIERSLKYYRKQNDPAKLVRILLEAKNFQSLFDVLLYRRKGIQNKKINCKLHFPLKKVAGRAFSIRLIYIFQYLEVVLGGLREKLNYFKLDIFLNKIYI